MEQKKVSSIELQVGVKILLKNQNGKFLLLLRNSDMYPEIGEKWDIVGGRIDPGESLFTNLKREIKEETQLDLIQEPVLIGAQDILSMPGRHVVRLTYIGEIIGEPILNEEHKDYKWFEIFEMNALPKKKIDHFLKDLLDKGIIN